MEILLFKLSTYGPCNLMSKLLSKMNIDYKELFVDKDKKAEKLANKYNVSSVPTIIIKNNKVVGKIVGLRSPKQIKEVLDKFNQ